MHVTFEFSLDSCKILERIAFIDGRKQEEKHIADVYIQEDVKYRML